jgi:hypothetical protein
MKTAIGFKGRIHPYLVGTNYQVAKWGGGAKLKDHMPFFSEKAPSSLSSDGPVGVINIFLIQVIHILEPRLILCEVFT